MTSWRILADDLTGALDTAAAFSGACDVPVFLAPHDAMGVDPVQAIATGTRDMEPAVMADVLRACLPWLAAPGHFAFKKVDSLLRGNSFAEVAWLLRHGGFIGVVFAPAFPAQGRFTRGGRHWVGRPDALTEAMDLVRAFSALGIDVRVGVDEAGLPAKGGVVIADVATDADLAALARLSRSADAQRWLWCGSAGLAWALAQHARHAPTGDGRTRPGATHFVTASRHPVLRGQLAALAESGVPCSDLAPAQPLAAAAAEALLARRTRELIDTLPRPDNLVVVGGDTLLALCRAAGVSSLRASAGPRGGWGCARLQGGAWHGVTCYSRSGAFGAPDDLSALLATLTQKEHSP